MEHIDALEAVRRLTLERDALLSVVVERDALAEQVKRLEAEVANTTPRQWEVVKHGLWAHKGEGFTAYVEHRENSGSHFGDFYAQVCCGKTGIKDIAPFDSFDRAADHAITVGLDLTGNAPQAPERRATAETDAETGEGGNGAPRKTTEPQKWDGLSFGGVAILLKEKYDGTQTCERCKHAVPGAHAMLCTHHSPHTTGQHGERGHWPVVLKTDRCGDWEWK